MFKAFVVLASWLLAAVCADAEGVREGMTRAEVEAEVGKPLSVLARGETTVMRYPNDGRVELVDGKVTRVVRVRHASDPATPEEVAAEEAAKAAKAESEAAKAKAAADAKAEVESSKAGAEAQRELESAVDRMTEEHAAAPTATMGELGMRESPSRFWTLLGVGALVQVGVGMVILKLAFKWADVHADWSQMLWPALAGMAGGVAVRAVGYAALGVSEFFRVDDAVSYLALLAALLKTTHACTWQRAIAVAAAAKLMTLVVWVFLSVALTQMLFA